MFRKELIAKILFLILASFFVMSCSKKSGGCLNKDHTEGGLNSKGAFGNFLASTITKMITQGIYGDARFWDKNKFFNDNGTIKIKEGTFRSGDNPSLIYQMYTGLISNYQLKLIISIGLVLYLVFLGVGIIMGTKELKIKDLAGDIFRISVVMLFTSKMGWTAYFNLIIKPIVLGGYYLGTQFVLALDPASELTPFAGIDNNLAFILSWPAFNKFLGLLLSGLYGTFTAIVLLYAIFSFLIMNLKGIVIFASNAMICGFLLCSGPIFITLLLFEKTKDFFKNWFAALVSTGLQQMTIFVALVLVNHIGSGMIKAALFYEVCWSSILSLKIQIPMPGIIKSLGKWIGVSIPDYIINLIIPFVNFFVYLDTAMNPPPDFMGKVGALIIFSMIAAGTMMDIAVKLATKMSEFFVSSADTGVAKSASKGLDAAHSKIGDAAKSLGGAALEHARMQTVGRVTGELKQQTVKNAAEAQKNISELTQKQADLEKDGKKLDFADKISLAMSQLSLKKNKLEYKADSAIQGNLTQANKGMDFLDAESREKNEEKDDKSKPGKLAQILSKVNSSTTQGMSNTNVKEAIENNKEIFDETFDDMESLKEERQKAIESGDGNLINKFNETLDNKKKDFAKKMKDRGNAIVNDGNMDLLVSGGTTAKETEDFYKFLGGLDRIGEDKEDLETQVDPNEERDEDFGDKDLTVNGEDEGDNDDKDLSVNGEDEYYDEDEDEDEDDEDKDLSVNGETENGKTGAYKSDEKVGGSKGGETGSSKSVEKGGGSKSGGAGSGAKVGGSKGGSGLTDIQEASESEENEDESEIENNDNDFEDSEDDDGIEEELDEEDDDSEFNGQKIDDFEQLVDEDSK